MQLQDGRVSFSLDITNYQFPQIDNDAWEADWLNIRVRLQYAEHTWTHDDPSLTTFEVQAWTDWLEDVAQHLDTFAAWRRSRLTTMIAFTEPNLCFEVLDHHPTGAPATLRVYLGLESRPPFFALLNHVGPDSNPDDVWIEFPLDGRTLRRTIDRLREQLERYPVRVGLPHIPPTT
ncbi:WapI family immunity protein [Deinococcus pimensis]|uniref:WapI family immunity protein n=1 Tax=Deinococcus pimensis TaxID=309888 RepID=UPI00069334FE|nr:hypothetical protein [Deinococcus pimensis]